MLAIDARVMSVFAKPGQTALTVTPEVASSAAFLTGPANEIRDRLEAQREDVGISYIVIQGERPEALEAFAEGVVVPLAGK